MEEDVREGIVYERRNHVGEPEKLDQYYVIVDGSCRFHVGLLYAFSLSPAGCPDFPHTF